MNAGDVLLTTIGPLVLGDRVITDRSCFQYEPGWWAFHEGRDAADDPSFFVSDDGEVYGNTRERPNAYDVSAGHVLQLCRECDGPIHGSGIDVHEGCRRGAL